MLDVGRQSEREDAAHRHTDQMALDDENPDLTNRKKAKKAAVSEHP